MMKKSIFLLLLSVLLVLCLASCDVMSDPKDDGTTAETEAVTTPIQYTLVLEADKTTAKRGDTVTLSSALVADGADDLATEDPIYTIVTGGEYATLAGDTLTISNTAPDGATILVQATEGASHSNTVKITVTVPVASIVISEAKNVTAPIAGQTLNLKKKVNPTGAPDHTTWVITEGKEIATLDGDLLTVSETAEPGNVIKVKAVAGEIASNELTFTVRSATESVDIDRLTISAANLNLLPGKSAVITTAVEPTNATGTYTLKIDEGAEYAIVNGNVLMINDDAPANAVIKVRAVADTASSNVLTFTVVDLEVAIESIEISAPNLTPIAGKSVVFTKKITPANATEETTWVISAGSDYASFEGNVLMIKDETPAGTEIKVKAVCGEIASNEITLTVKPAVETVKIETITISSTTTQVLKGNSYVLGRVVSPANATEEALWKILKGAEYVSFSKDTLTISASAPTGAEIMVQSVCGEVESNVLTFTVAASREEIMATTYALDLSKDAFTVDKKGTSLPTLVVEVVNMLGDRVEDQEIEFILKGDGANYVKLNANGSNCTFEAVGHGGAEIEVRIKDTEIVETVSVDAIVPPDSVALPEVFAERTDIEYAFSKLNHTDNSAEKLPFVSSARGEGIFCKDLSYTFRHESGKTGNEVATYENGAIVFHMTGKVTVIVTSASGSKVEASTAYTFKINEGINVHTFTEAEDLLRDNKKYHGEEVNFVVLEKPVGYNPSYQYGYALVPPTALRPLEEQTVKEIHSGSQNRIQVVNNNAIINGNNHPIDGSQLKTFTQEDFDAFLNGGGNPDTPTNVSSIFSVEAWSATAGDTTVMGKDYIIKLYNLHTIGNAPITYNPSASCTGAYIYGISVGSFSQYDVDYTIEAENLTATATVNGLGFTGIIGGTVSNVYAGNCYSTGIIAKSSIMTLDNVKFGPCGATGIELAPEECDKAGSDNNQNQNITIDGVIDAADNINDLNTNYFQNYKIGDTGVPAIIKGNLQMYTDEQVSHLKNAQGQYIFVSLIFNNMSTLAPNTSQVSYPEYREGGIINLSEITSGIDTTHQFVRIPIIVPITGLGNQVVGSALFYNFNYQPK